MRTKLSTNPECRELSLEICVEERGSLQAWVRYMKEQTGWEDKKLLAWYMEAGFLDEEVEGALISLREDLPPLPKPQRRMLSYREGKLRQLRRKGETLADYLRPMVEYGHPRGFIIDHYVKQGFYDEEIEGALISLRKDLLPLPKPKRRKPSFREAKLSELKRDGETMVDYLRPLVEHGRPRKLILERFAKLGFYDEEIEGALIELEQGPWPK